VGRVSLTSPVVDPVLDPDEANLVRRAIDWLRAAAPSDAEGLVRQLGRVRALGVAVDETPSLGQPSRFGGAARDEDWFVAALSSLDPLTAELALPEKAVLARGFLSAKIALLRSFAAALAPDAPGWHADLAAGFARELSQSIYTLIATEILTDLQWDGAVAPATRVRAARQLILFWDRALELEIDDFCPILEAAWSARSRVAALYGALLGTAEYLRLVEADCPPEFLDFFCQDGPRSPGRDAAFEEFLFDLTWEELGRVRSAMERSGHGVVDGQFVAGVLGRPIAGPRIGDPDALYRSYRRRRTGAEFRRLTGAPGPARVAEAYLMIDLLERGG
jgi:hypothetical protein